MKHHFGDMLNRGDGHWTISENRNRWSARYSDVQNAPQNTNRLTLTKEDKNWERVSDFPKLIELTLHEPSKDQARYLNQVKGLKALRITHFRPKTLDFIESQSEVEELVLEYVSGFDSLSPLADLPKLRSFHAENLRRVKDFSSLIGCEKLRSLSINGTFDWKQPIETLAFLNNLPALEYFGTWQVKFLAQSPIFENVQRLPKLKNIKIGWSDMTVEDFAYLQAKFGHIDGAKTSAFKFTDAYDQAISSADMRAKMSREKFLEIPRANITDNGDRIIQNLPSAFFIGKGTRFYEGPREKVLKKCNDYQTKFDDLVKSCEAKIG